MLYDQQVLIQRVIALIKDPGREKSSGFAISIIFFLPGIILQVKDIFLTNCFLQRFFHTFG
jgi:hypothetical protein